MGNVDKRGSKEIHLSEVDYQEYISQEIQEIIEEVKIWAKKLTLWSKDFVHDTQNNTIIINPDQVKEIQKLRKVLLDIFEDILQHSDLFIQILKIIERKIQKNCDACDRQEKCERHEVLKINQNIFINLINVCISFISEDLDSFPEDLNCGCIKEGSFYKRIFDVSHHALWTITNFTGINYGLLTEYEKCPNGNEEIFSILTDFMFLMVNINNNAVKRRNQYENAYLSSFNK